MTDVKINLPEYTEEDALTKIIMYLQKNKQYWNNCNYGNNNLNITELIDHCLDEAKTDWNKQNRERNSRIFYYHLDRETNSKPFYDAAWNLCLRGILSPGLINIDAHSSTQKTIRIGVFNLTSYGKQWLNKISSYECIPSHYGRFSQLLSQYSQRFGKGYHIRSQEALSCYRSHTYLACCTMCGAASESILLTLATAKNGNEEEVLKMYKGSNGRSKIENLLLKEQNSYVHRELPKYTDLLKYWRDYAAHGFDTTISETEAFTSLLLLLRFAQFSDEKWDKITTSQSN